MFLDEDMSVEVLDVKENDTILIKFPDKFVLDKETQPYMLELQKKLQEKADENNIKIWFVPKSFSVEKESNNN